MTRFATLPIAAWLTVTIPALPQNGSTDPQPVIVQGAMQLEIEKLVGRLDNASIERVGGWTFWRGSLDGRPVIVSKTLKGMSNAAAATVIGIEHYHPRAIVNQGTAGGHDPGLHLYDIVVGGSSVNIEAFKSRYRSAGTGSSPLDWMPLDLTASEGSAGNDPSARRPARFLADGPLLAAARQARGAYTRGRVVEGVIGSSDVWNEEIDRVAWFHTTFGTSVEEMETASAAQIASLFNVPFLGIRVVSNNITNGGAYNPKTGEACEDYVYQVVKAYIAAAVKR
jgi:adenosylhomocysteine nucleosidase